VGRLTIIGAGLLWLGAFVGAASAADRLVPTKAPPLISPASVYDWSGFYVGLNGGGGSSRECWTLTSNNGVAIVPRADEGCHNATGGLVGGQVGYRWQSSNWVFGVEAQGDWADLTGSNLSTGLTVLPLANQTTIDAIGLFTGQIGYAWNNALLYVKGGAAVTNNRYTSVLTAIGLQVYDTSELRWGGAIGAGIEYGFAPNWSVAVEYDHLFMGKREVAWPATPLAVSRTDDISQSVDIGLVRVNYRFGGPIVAKY
jgi:outer membrane immunogenic protein